LNTVLLFLDKKNVTIKSDRKIESEFRMNNLRMYFVVHTFARMIALESHTMMRHTGVHIYIYNCFFLFFYWYICRDNQ